MKVGLSNSETQKFHWKAALVYSRSHAQRGNAFREALPPGKRGGTASQRYQAEPSNEK